MCARMTKLQLLEHNLELKDPIYGTAYMGVAGTTKYYWSTIWNWRAGLWGVGYGTSSMGVAGASTTYGHFVVKSWTGELLR